MDSEPIVTVATTTPSFNSYLEVIGSAYLGISKCRLVCKHETDVDALKHFEDLCNMTVPKTKEQEELKIAIRQLYYANRTSFSACLNQCPQYSLVIEGRVIVATLGIQDLVYIEWDADSKKFIVHKNEKKSAVLGPRRKEPRSPKTSHGRHKKQNPKYIRKVDTASLDERIKALEEQLNKLESPRSDPESPVSEEKQQWGDIGVDPTN
jgi:hypothetical protein